MSLGESGLSSYLDSDEMRTSHSVGVRSQLDPWLATLARHIMCLSAYRPVDHDMGSGSQDSLCK